eukprot:3067000-Rhodomonas_salina.4
MAGIVPVAHGSEEDEDGGDEELNTVERFLEPAPRPIRQGPARQRAARCNGTNHAMAHSHPQAIYCCRQTSCCVRCGHMYDDRHALRFCHEARYCICELRVGLWMSGEGPDLSGSAMEFSMVRTVGMPSIANTAMPMNTGNVSHLAPEWTCSNHPSSHVTHHPLSCFLASLPLWGCGVVERLSSSGEWDAVQP